MISPDKLQSSIDGYSIGIGDEIVWAPYVMNNAPCQPNGDILSVPEGGKASQWRFQEVASFAVDTLISRGDEPSACKLRASLVDGSLPIENGQDYNYRGGVDCSGFAYFALKGAGVNIDHAIMVPPSAVRHAASWAGWQEGTPELTEIIERAADKALSVIDFANTFYPTPEPHKNVNTARFDENSSPISQYEAEPGDLVIYRLSPQTPPNHVALIQDVESNGDLSVVHSGRISWDGDPGGIETFTIPGQKINDFTDAARGHIELKRINGLY